MSTRSRRRRERKRGGLPSIFSAASLRLTTTTTAIGDNKRNIFLSSRNLCSVEACRSEEEEGSCGFVGERGRAGGREGGLTGRHGPRSVGRSVPLRSRAYKFGVTDFCNHQTVVSTAAASGFSSSLPPRRQNKPSFSGPRGLFQRTNGRTDGLSGW